MLTGYVLIICHKHKLLFRYVDMFSFFATAYARIVHGILGYIPVILLSIMSTLY